MKAFGSRVSRITYYGESVSDRRLATEVATRDELLACLDHLLTSSSNATLMTRELRNTLVDYAAGNTASSSPWPVSCS